MRVAMTQLNLSARAYHRILKLARTIAELTGGKKIQSAHLADALHASQPAEVDVELGRSSIPFGWGQRLRRSKVDGILWLQVTLKLAYLHQVTSVTVDLYLYKEGEWSKYVRARIIP